MDSIVIVLIVLLLPRVMVLLSDHFKLFNALGPVFLCYASGFLLSFVISDTSMATTLSEVCVPLAIPLILFSADLSSLKKLAKPALISFCLIIVSVAAVSCTAAFLFNGSVADSAKISGMLVGLYTGGTPNLMAIGLALGVPDETILLANTADLIAGGVYFMLLISVMPKLYRKLLPAFDKSSAGTEDRVLESSLGTSFNGNIMTFSLPRLAKRLPALLLSLLCVGVSLGCAWLFTGNATNIMVVMLGVSTLGVAFSFIRKIRELPGSYTAGQYLIYMFSLAIGMSFDLSLITLKALMLLIMLLFVQFGSAAVHLLLARLFRIDADTAIITSTAGIYGPAFIPPVAGALKNKSIVLTGLICGILGYAVGNYLGIGLASLLGLII